jgi:hypothetical protein
VKKDIKHFEGPTLAYITPVSWVIGPFNYVKRQTALEPINPA